MKRVLLLLALVCVGFVWAQEEYYDAYNEEHTTNTTGDEILNSEPVVISYIIDQGSEPIPEKDLTTSAEIYITEFSKKIHLPLWYRWREFSFNAMIPYYVSKKIPMSDGVTIGGLGDISLGAGYGKYLDKYSTYFDVNLTAKMPTGDPEAEKEEDEITYMVALGSDTWDFTFGGSGYYFMDQFTFKGNMIYTMNGTYETEMWDGSKQETDRGDDFLFSVGADYRWQYNLTFGLNASYGIHFASETEGTEGMDKTVFMDLKPVVKYPISLFEFVVGAKIPVSTETPDDDFNEGNRSTAFFFRTNYRIF
ncbi:MAG: transporter [Candidatus Delongbacteria bacterium]|nr:transporter [Candidatus Delongbacteria bacterium]